MENLNISEVVTNSFNKFLCENKVEYPKLTRDLISKWNFEKEIENEYKISNENTLNALPSLNSLNSNESKPQIIKALLTVQNVIENQLYLSARYNKNKKTYEINKYFENVSENEMLNDEYDNDETLLNDRLALECRDIPGLNPKISSLYPSLCTPSKIIVYDYSNSHSKLNEIILVVGAAYRKSDSVMVIHAWNITNQFIEKMIPRISPPVNENGYKDLNSLMNITFCGDELSKEYAILFIFSQIFNRVGQKNIGSFPLNYFTNKNVTKYHLKFLDLLKKIGIFVLAQKVTISELNSKRFYPRYDIEKEVLETGEFQCCDKTYLVIDESEMNEGKLEDFGVKNFATLKNIIDFQTINYEYPYNNIEMPHDIEICIFSCNKSIFVSPFLCCVPIEESICEENEDIIHNQNVIDSAFYYVNKIKFNQEFTNEFKISKELCDLINKDYMSLHKNDFNIDLFDLIMRLARIRAISQNRKELTFDDYARIRDLEQIRLKRLNAIKTNK